MGLIRKAVLIGAGYVLGARAGTDRYDDILRTARALAARPEVQAGLSALREKVGFARPAGTAADVVPDPPTTDRAGLASRHDPGAPVVAAPLTADPTLGSPVDPASVRRGAGRV